MFVIERAQVGLGCFLENYGYARTGCWAASLHPLHIVGGWGPSDKWRRVACMQYVTSRYPEGAKSATNACGP